MLHAQALRALGHSPAAIAASTAALPAAIAVSSGSAATASVVSSLARLHVGDKANPHLVSVGDVYGGTSRYMLRVAGEHQGVETTFVDMAYRAAEGQELSVDEMERDIEERVVRAIRPETKVSASERERARD